MKDYERELKELEENEADEIKGLGKEVVDVTGNSKADLSNLMAKIEKVLASMKAQEDAAAAEKAKEAAAPAPANPAAAAAKAPAPAKAAPAATVAQSLVVDEASSWVSSHFVLSLF